MNRKNRRMNLPQFVLSGLAAALLVPATLAAGSDSRDARNIPFIAGSSVPAAHVAGVPLDAGDIITSWALPDGFFGWGIGFDGSSLWVSSPVPSWNGNGTLSRFSVDGMPAGVSYPYSWTPGNGPADVAYNWNTGNLWVMDVGSGNCIHEINPASGETGSTICPAFPISQRGLAYDPIGDTWFAGGWNDHVIYHFDASGAILSQTDVGLGISGLAYNHETEHLFAITNASPGGIYVLDAADSFAVIDQFSPSEGFGDFSGAGLEIDCKGRLWAVDQIQQTVALIESGESISTLCSVEIFEDGFEAAAPL